MVFDSQYSTRAATVLLLDMSWSMSWDGRFAAAKKVALAMESLCRSKYPQDYFGNRRLLHPGGGVEGEGPAGSHLEHGRPASPTSRDGSSISPIDLLKKRSATRNQQIIVITDGQPTAYCRQGRLYCEWPLSFGGISQRAAEETLKEAKRVTQRGITINTFMLDDSPVLKGFVDEMTRLNKGRAFYTRPTAWDNTCSWDYCWASGARCSAAETASSSENRPTFLHSSGQVSAGTKPTFKGGLPVQRIFGFRADRPNREHGGQGQGRYNLRRLYPTSRPPRHRPTADRATSAQVDAPGRDINMVDHRTFPEHSISIHVLYTRQAYRGQALGTAGQVARGIYATAAQQRVVVLHVFAKKSRRTPRRAMATARERMKQVAQ